MRLVVLWDFMSVEMIMQLDQLFYSFDFIVMLFLFSKVRIFDSQVYIRQALYKGLCTPHDNAGEYIKTI